MLVLIYRHRKDERLSWSLCHGWESNPCRSYSVSQVLSITPWLQITDPCNNPLVQWTCYIIFCSECGSICSWILFSLLVVTFFKYHWWDKKYIFLIICCLDKILEIWNVRRFVRRMKTCWLIHILCVSRVLIKIITEICETHFVCCIWKVFFLFVCIFFKRNFLNVYI